MKTIPALIAGIITSALIVLIMVAVGVNALLNPNTVAEASSPSDSTVVLSSGASSDTAQVQQLQQRISEYQAREKQYQSQLNQLETNLQQANDNLQQYQQLVDTLQQMGIIRVDANGQIMLPRFRRDD
jgi:TolA-binding protein